MAGHSDNDMGLPIFEAPVKGLIAIAPYYTKIAAQQLAAVRGIIEEVGICPPKSCIVPSRLLGQRQWDVHGFETPVLAKLARTSHASYWHFRAISTNWKQFDRLARRAPAPDPETAAVMARVFPE